MLYWSILFLSVIFNVLAQLILKIGMRNIEVFQSVSFIQKLVSVLNPWFFSAMVFYGSSFFLYSMALSKFEINKAYPVSVVSAIVLIAILSVLFFGEGLSTSKMVGMTVCIVGIVLILRG